MCVCVYVGWLSPADTKDRFPFLSFSVRLLPELLSIHMLGVFTDFYQRLNVIPPVAAEAVPSEMYFVYRSLN